MSPEEFSARLRRERYPEVTVVEWPANGMLEPHTHPFQAKALILSGEITLVIDQHETLYRPGEVFLLKHDTLHPERYGPEGVRYLVGRK